MIGCKSSVTFFSNPEIQFLDEHIVTNDSIFSGSSIGGLSGIDYNPISNHFNLVCDDAYNPRFYQANIAFKDFKIDTIIFEKLTKFDTTSQLLVNRNVLDLEGIRMFDNTFLFSSEGSINYQKEPSIFQTDRNGKILYSYTLPSYFLADSTAINQPRHNAVFEGITVSFDKKGFWAATELPLEKDGYEPSYNSNGAPVRLTYFDFKLKKAIKQFIYSLDKLSKDPKGTFAVNGVTEILQISKKQFLVLEREYVAGYGTQGNNVRIYLADFTNATNTLNDVVLKEKHIPATKKLLFTFESVRSQLTRQIVDNLEGMTFGPKLPNGNLSLLLVADNNFNPPAQQLNQFILLELKFN
ncbi:esterase-like activity of phytase family protein [Aquimarina sp. ERC-38]|uniref:esterase-like activity of phytase family protein n=1 Tax=Aquimarina sp. ERC-38 TaxID=2949996 RepID=UPI0022468D35|nr:esterase-like activity of phytase family protein [Aquimarina sp. ERC-38]UZO80809.1 esterase-like activity of phytase family protein [Aquimarina sp. ERC-38]